MGILYTDTVDVGFLQTFLYLKLVSHGRHTTIDRTGAYRHQYIAVVAKLTQDLDVIHICNTTLYKADVAFTNRLDIGQRRPVELDQFDQLQDALIDIKQ